jgi:hypothetical protein
MVESKMQLPPGEAVLTMVLDTLQEERHCTGLKNFFMKKVKI